MEKYNLIEYRDNVVRKTLLVKDDKMFNVMHMVLGMGSELMSELPLALRKKSLTNITEELGDIEFFVVGYCIFENIGLPDKMVPTTNHLLMNPLLLMNIAIGNLQTIVKKELVSGVKKLDGVVVTKEKLQEIVFDILTGIQMFADEQRLLLDQGVRPANARKLNVRYDGGGFSADKSLNRDYAAETIALTGQVNTEDFTKFCSCGQKEVCSKCSNGTEIQSSRETDLITRRISEYIFQATKGLNEEQYNRAFENIILTGSSNENVDKVIARVIAETKDNA